MTVKLNEHGQEIHFPNNPNKFEFDDEVASIFDSMAVRSIPGYEVCKDMTVMYIMKVIADNVLKGKNTKILDIGCSTGTLYDRLFDAIWTGYDNRDGIFSRVSMVAVDDSEAMVDWAKRKVPVAIVHKASPLDLNFKEVVGENFDVVVMSYVAQFVPKLDRKLLFSIVSSLLAHNGVLILSEKEELVCPFSEIINEMYIQTRLDAGYTPAEIKAKTHALANSMWPQTEYATLAELVSSGFRSRQEVFRWGPFAMYLVGKVG